LPTGVNVINIKKINDLVGVCLGQINEQVGVNVVIAVVYKSKAWHRMKCDSSGLKSPVDRSECRSDIEHVLGRAEVRDHIIPPKKSNDFVKIGFEIGTPIVFIQGPVFRDSEQLIKVGLTDRREVEIEQPIVPFRNRCQVIARNLNILRA
jgi:hypothetical protein